MLNLISKDKKKVKVRGGIMSQEHNDENCRIISY